MSNENKPGVLLDITTLVTLTSDICLKTDDIIKLYGDLDGWKWISKDTRRQLIDEKKDPVYQKIIDRIKDKKWYVCKSSFIKWRDMLNKSGSFSEKKRVKDLIDKLIVIDDNIPKFMEWMDDKIWTEHSKVVFGTAYKNADNIVLVTGNKRAAMSLYDYGYDELDFIVHRSRKYVGDKYDNIRNMKPPLDRKVMSC